MTESLQEWDQRVGGFVSPPALKEYRDRYAEHFAIRRRDGIVELRMHTEGGPAIFSLGLKNAWGQLLAQLGTDPANEVLIVTGTGDRWIDGVHRPSFAEPVPEWPADVAYQHAYLDGLKMLENLVFGVDTPTIGAINGPGIRTELALLCDISLCTPQTTLGDGNFAVGGQAPGDGMHLVLQELVGPKRAGGYLYSGERIDAETALRLGLVNEITENDQLLPRAWEIAMEIMKKSRTARRMTHAVIQRPWRRRLTEDLGFGLAHEQFAARLV
jgi:enoyl-CoA hydratase/carnithine racemase